MIVKLLCPVLILIAATPLGAAAAPRVVANLRVDQMLGQTSSTAQMRARARHLAWRTSSAARQMGLTPQELTQFNQAVADGTLSYGPVPQHLDAMSMYRHGRVQILRNVSIPKHTMGWSLAIQEDGRTVALYLPQSCGNLSMLVTPRVRVARVIPKHTPPPPVIASSPAPVASPVPTRVAGVSEFPPVIVHRASPGWLAALIPILIGGGGGSTTTPPPVNNKCPPVFLP